MAISAEQIRRLYDESKEELVEAFGKMLREFGYPVENDWILEQITKFYNDESVTGGPAMFIQGWLEDGIE